MRPRWHYSDSDQAWLAQALDFVARAEHAALRAHGTFHIVLAGGNTPRVLYEALAREAHDWPRWQVWFGDERCLPAGHAARNSRMAGSALLDGVPVGAVHGIPGELGAQAAAAAYASELTNIGAFDLVLLGLGEDGHTASLFPGQALDQHTDTVAVFDAPKPPPERVSLSARRLSLARHVLFLVSGRDKHAAIARWRQGEPIPAAAIQPEAGVDVLLAPDLSTSGVLS